MKLVKPAWELAHGNIRKGCLSDVAVDMYSLFVNCAACIAQIAILVSAAHAASTAGKIFPMCKFVRRCMANKATD